MNTLQPLVSVLMTAYNREKYIGEAIQSVLDSTYSNFELIIVDDQSKDRTVEIAKGFEAVDPRVKIYVNEKNLGDYPNRNKAASYAKGKYLKYVDADDKIYPHGLEIMVQSIEQFPNAAFGIGNIQDEEKMFPFLLNPIEAYERFYFKKKRSFGAAPLSVIIKTVIFRQEGGFSGKRMVGDFELWHILGAKYPVVLMQGGLTWYRKHDEQEMTIGRKDLIFNYQYLDVSENMLKNLCPLDSQKATLLLKRVKKRKSRLVFSSLKKKQVANAIEIYKSERLNLISLIRNSFF